MKGAVGFQLGSEPPVERRIAIETAGTPGRVHLGLAIADVYLQPFENLDLLFIGGHGGFEGSLMIPRRYCLEPENALPILSASVKGGSSVPYTDCCFPFAQSCLEARKGPTFSTRTRLGFSMRLPGEESGSKSAIGQGIYI